MYGVVPTVFSVILITPAFELGAFGETVSASAASFRFSQTLTIFSFRSSMLLNQCSSLRYLDRQIKICFQVKNLGERWSMGILQNLFLLLILS